MEDQGLRYECPRWYRWEREHGQLCTLLFAVLFVVFCLSLALGVGVAASAAEGGLAEGGLGRASVAAALLALAHLIAAGAVVSHWMNRAADRVLRTFLARARQEGGWWIYENAYDTRIARAEDITDRSDAFRIERPDLADGTHRIVIHGGINGRAAFLRACDCSIAQARTDTDELRALLNASLSAT